MKINKDKKLNFERVHDKKIYLEEDRYDKPKEIFKILGNLALQSGVLKEGSKVGDFGCASGEFLYYLSQRYPTAKYYGYDVVPDLVEKARERVPGVEFFHGSVLDKSLLPPASP